MVTGGKRVGHASLAFAWAPSTAGLVACSRLVAVCCSEGQVVSAVRREASQGERRRGQPHREKLWRRMEEQPSTVMSAG